MNTPNDDLSLLRKLRALPRERAPSHDLWSGIATRLPGVATKNRKRSAWHMPRAFALAASLALGAALGLHLVSPNTNLPPRDDLVLREADAISREYRAAFAQLGALPEPLRPAAAELERGAQDIRVALREQPDAAYLLTRLRSTYEQRLRLGQRVAAT